MRLGRIGRSLVPVVLVAGLPLAIQGAAASAASRGAIKAVVLKSWNLCLQMDMWSDLNTNWSNYGSVPVSIDYSNTNLCQGTITYDALVAIRADVMILSGSAGGLQEYSRDEIAAIRQYA